MLKNWTNGLISAVFTGVSIGFAAFAFYKYSYWKSNGKSDDEENQSRRKKERSETEGNDVNQPCGSENSRPGEQSKKAGQGTGMVTSDGYTTIQVKVPKDMVGPIIGRQGANIKQIQAETKTKVDFSKQEDESEERTITIRGSEKGTQDAELKILHIVYGQASKQTRKLQVPQRALGFIIGKGGETIQRMQAESGCRIKVDSNRERTDPQSMSDVTLVGDDEQINAATIHILSLIDEWEEKTRSAKQSKERSRPRRPVSHRPQSVVTPGSPLPLELWPNHSDFVECYVTATVNPSHVWVQVLSPRSAKLEEINTQLSQLYSQSAELSDDMVTLRPTLGTTVAARNPSDNMWYRGKVMAYSTTDNTVDIYYIDYGDSCWVDFTNDNLQLLRTEYYHLPAQAIECYTDISLNPDFSAHNWTEDECDMFEKLSHTGTWAVLMGQVVSWKSKLSSEGGGASMSDELPVLKLIDTNSEQDVDITTELVSILGQQRDITPSSQQHPTPSDSPRVTPIVNGAMSHNQTAPASPDSNIHHDSSPPPDSGTIDKTSQYMTVTENTQPLSNGDSPATGALPPNTDTERHVVGDDGENWD